MSRRGATLALALAGAAFLALAGFGYERTRAKGDLKFDTAAADKGRITARVTASGTLSAIVTVQVGTQVSGTIAALYADYNTKVRKGELIAKIDSRLFEAAVQQARANVAAAEGNLVKAKAQSVDADRQAKRETALFGQQLVPQADTETAQATADADRAAVAAAAGALEQAKAQLHQAEVNLAYTDIRSPTDGTVISRNVDVGQTVAASLQAPTLFLIAQDLGSMQVDTSVAEADIGKIRPGMRASFSVDAYPNERFGGTVRQVRNAPQTVQNVVTYDAVIDVPNPDLKLKPGMTANCTFVWAQRDDALRVPNAALRFRPPRELAPARKPSEARGAAPGRAAGSWGGHAGRPGSRTPADEKTLFVLRDGKPLAVAVRTGISDGSVTEIVSGDLKPQDAVITDVSTGGAKGAAASAPGGFPRRMF